MEKRFRLLIKGIVQGVGFRPFLYRSAKKYNLCGLVKNTSRGVILEVEGSEKSIKEFISYIINDPPPLSLIENYESREIKRQYSKEFEILSSEDDGEGGLLVSPDIAICANCKKIRDTL